MGTAQIDGPPPFNRRREQMTVVLRHKRFPFIMVYNDPKESWDSFVKKMLLEEIANSEFDKFVEEPSVPSFYRKLFNPVEEEDE